MSIMKTDIGKIKILKSTKHGSEHWIMQRFTAAVLAVLFVWFMYFCIKVSGKSYEEVAKTCKETQHFIPLMLFLTTAFYHSTLGMQVVIEDYVNDISYRFALIVLLKIFSFVTVFALVFSAIYFLLGL
jgi:succinate dehydrogenase / fumarate reductase, membrane anchor subunit